MSRPRRLRWSVPDPAPPKHPYRDTLVVYAVLAVVIVAVAWATGGSLSRAVIVAAFFFVVATAWNTYRWRARLREADERTSRNGTGGRQ
jgi:hypothetical protein